MTDNFSEISEKRPDGYEAEPIDTDETTENEASTNKAPAAQKSPSKLRKYLIMLLVPVIVIGGAITYWMLQQGKVSTDNAYLKLDMVSVSPEIGGKIVEVGVTNGDEVKQGDILFRIDPEPYQVQLKQAKAAIAAAQANVTALANSSDLSGADLAAAKEDIAYSQSLFARQQALMVKGFTTKADYDAAQHAVQQARENLRSAQARQREAAAKLATGPAVPGQNPEVAAALAQQDEAALNLRRTVVKAPAAGQIAEADRLQLGEAAVANIPMLTLVKSSGSYVEANFKETDLKNMRIGQRATISFDAYPDVELEGHVASIGAGTGSQFSVIPAQNATGNWVKVTQRVPVKIAIDGKSTRPLIAGLSSYVTVYTDE